LKEKVGIIIEARMGSTRLASKTLKLLHGKPMLEMLVERLKRVKNADEIIVATTDLPEDTLIIELADKLNIKSYQGSSEDVLDRVLKAAKHYDIDIIVEAWGDSPVVDSELVETEIQAFLDNNVDYVGCNLKETYPYGLEVCVFSKNTLQEVSDITKAPEDRENVSLYIYEHPEKYRLLNIEAEGKHNRPDLRLVVDHPEDFELIESIFGELYDDKPDFDYDDILDLFEKKPELILVNQAIEEKSVRC